MAERNYLVLNEVQDFISAHETESEAEKQAVLECVSSMDEDTFYVVKIIGKAERLRPMYKKVGAPQLAKPKATSKGAK